MQKKNYFIKLPESIPCIILEDGTTYYNSCHYDELLGSAIEKGIIFHID